MDAHVPQCAGVVRLSRIDLARRWLTWLLAIAWMLLLACLPWWLGLPLLLVLATLLLIDVSWLHEHAAIIRRGLRWGLPGLLWAVLRALGGGAMGFTLAALGALIGFSLLVLLESWLDRKPQNKSVRSPSPEWRDMALAPIGPKAAIIELEPPQWFSIDGPTTDKRLGVTHYADHTCVLAGNHQIDGIDPLVSVVSTQDWLAIMLVGSRGVVLYNRSSGRQHRLRGWQLYGWDDQQPWLSRGEGHAPLPLTHVLGRDQPDE